MKKKSVTVLPDIDWMQKKVGRLAVNRDKDVHITITTGGKHGVDGTKRIAFSFRNNIANVWLDKECKYLIFGSFKNRLFFRPVEAKVGYALSSKGLNTYMTATLYKDEVEKYEPFIGDYHLRFDEYYELYYIDIEQEGVL